MRRTRIPDPRQQGFPLLLDDADRVNQARAFERATAHLPGTMAEGIAHYRRLLEQHHDSVLAGEEREAKRIQGEASLLAQKLNGGRRGYLADDDAPGCVLQRATAAEPGAVPLWGQVGSVVIEASSMRLRVETRGLYGVCGPGSFNAHAVDPDRPFLSPTGFRSFLGYGPGPRAGQTVEAYARQVIEQHVAGELCGRLLPIDPEYRARMQGDTP
jgi:hypothetical protein